MAKTLAQIQEQIEKLQTRAVALRAKEAAGVIERIKVAIEAYDLKPDDLFSKSEDIPPVGRLASTKRATPRKSSAAAKKAGSRPIKYSDNEGNTWVGHGKRPAWFVRALDSGKTPADLLVMKSADARQAV